MCLIYDDKLFTKEVEEELSQRRALVKETCKKYISENLFSKKILCAVSKIPLKQDLCLISHQVWACPQSSAEALQEKTEVH